MLINQLMHAVVSQLVWFQLWIMVFSEEDANRKLCEKPIVFAHCIVVSQQVSGHTEFSDMAPSLKKNYVLLLRYG